MQKAGFEHTTDAFKRRHCLLLSALLRLLLILPLARYSGVSFIFWKQGDFQEVLQKVWQYL